MRKYFAVALAVLGLLFVSISPASAAPSITKGGSCTLASGIKVNASATLANTSGSPSRGVFKYAAMSSDHKLVYGVAGSGEFRSAAYLYNASGTQLSTTGWFDYTGFSGGDYHYRAPGSGYLNVSGVATVKVSAIRYLSANNVEGCTVTLHSSN